MGNIIFNPDGKTLFRLIHKDRMDLGRCGIFGSQSVSARINRNILVIAVPQRTQHIQVQRFADAARFLRPVQYRNLFHCFRDDFQKTLSYKRAVQTHFNQSGLFAVSVFHVHHFFDGLTDTSHGDDHMLRLRIAIILEQGILRTGFLRNSVKQVFHDSRQFLIPGIGRFPVLEKHIRILRGSHLPAAGRV